MKIELATPTLLKITWPLYDDATHQEIVRRLSTVPGMEAGRGRSCYAPMIQLARLMELFTKASIDYRAMQAADVLGQRFFDSMAALHVNLEIDASGAIVAVGDNVSPLIQQLVEERAPALRSLVREAMANPKPQREPVAALPVAQSVEDARLGPLMKGIQNAKKKADEDAVKYPKRRKGKARQGSLGI